MKMPALSKPLTASVGALAMLALLAYVLWPSEQGATEQHAPEHSWGRSGVASPFGVGVAQAAAQPSASGGALAQASTSDTARALSSTSLAGTQIDGDWSVDSNGQLRASKALRQRFDYFLTLIGEMSVADMRAVVQREASASLQPNSVAQVMAMWDKYVKLQQHAWTTQVDLRQASTWSSALAERQQVRRELLGADFAYAFYADDDKQLQQHIAQTSSGLSAADVPPSTLATPGQPALHPEALQREAQHQAQWQAWEQRLQAARQHISQLKTAPELSAPQRVQAIDHYISTQFQGREQVRVRGLLGV